MRDVSVKGNCPENRGRVQLRLLDIKLRKLIHKLKHRTGGPQ